jgi:excisionase family DNA binding protein
MMRTTQRHEKQLLTVREAADFARVTPNTIRMWVRKGVLRHVRVGPGAGLIRLREDDLTRVVRPVDSD